MSDMATQSAVYEGGFVDPVGGSQSVFRAVMDAMARPGSVQPVAELARGPAPLSASAAALIITLADADTPVWLDNTLRKTEAVRDWIVFHTGAPIVATQSEAAFALVAAPEKLSAMNGFSLGTQEYPDRSTTLIVQVTSLSAGVPFELEGPGINGRSPLAPMPLPQHFSAQWAANHAAFPRGIDLIFAGPECVAAMPRSARLVKAEA